MAIIVATDLYGVTQALKDRFLAHVKEEIIWLSPWETELNPYADEATAHQVFVANDGFTAYSHKIKKAIYLADSEQIRVIGFSVGATAAWLCLSEDNFKDKVEACLFYGSRIRNYLDRSPNCLTYTVWSEHEIAFEPAALLKDIEKLNIPAVIEPNSKHGFMNPVSKNFSEFLLTKYLYNILESSL